MNSAQRASLRERQAGESKEAELGPNTDGTPHLFVALVALAVCVTGGRERRPGRLHAAAGGQAARWQGTDPPAVGPAAERPPLA